GCCKRRPRPPPRRYSNARRRRSSRRGSPQRRAPQSAGSSASGAASRAACQVADWARGSSWRSLPVRSPRGRITREGGPSARPSGPRGGSVFSRTCLIQSSLATLPQLRSVAEALRVTIDVFEVRSSGDGCSVHLSASAVLPIETVNSRALASVARCCRSPHRIDDWARLANIGGLDAVKYLDDDPARCPSGGTASGWTISATPGGFGMKITSYESAALNIPEDDPLANMPEEVGRTRPVVILRLRTDAGIEGIGVTLWGGRLSGSLRAAVDEL